MDFKYCKLEIFIPPDFLETLQKVLQAADVGHIGAYDSCMSFTPVTSFWRPLEGTHPYSGITGELGRETELKVEAVCLTERAKETVQAIKSVHPYEEPVINVIPLYLTGL